MSTTPTFRQGDQTKQRNHKKKFTFHKKKLMVFKYMINYINYNFLFFFPENASKGAISHRGKKHHSAKARAPLTIRLCPSFIQPFLIRYVNIQAVFRFLISVLIYVRKKRNKKININEIYVNFITQNFFFFISNFYPNS